MCQDHPAGWEHQVLTELVPQMQRSGTVVSLLPEGDIDVKFAVELGLSIMLDKPIVVVVRPGVRAPNKMILVADHLIEADLSTPQGKRRLAQTIGEIAAKTEPA